MVGDDRDCVKGLTQINAIRAPLHKVAAQIPRDHLGHGVSDTISSGDVNAPSHKVDELIATIGHMTR